MPLPTPTVGRRLLHKRTITCCGYERRGGLWDIDGWMTDVKTAPLSVPDRGTIPPGEPLHGMGIRLTIDESLTIMDIVAVTDFAPYRICPAITPSFKNLIGLSLAKGFAKNVRARVGGIQGCVHLVDLLGPMATTAFQTMSRFRRLKRQQTAAPRPVVPGPTIAPPQINTCHAWATDSEVVKREYPALYTGAR